MSDASLRDLERRWRETNAPSDGATYLLERVRVGELSRVRLEMAARCGHTAAAAACPEVAPVDDDQLMGEWVADILSGREDEWVCVVAATAAAELVPRTPLVDAAIDAARELLLQPDVERCDAAQEAQEDAALAAHEADHLGLPGAGALEAANQAAGAAWRAYLGDPESNITPAGCAADAAGAAWSAVPADVPDGPERARHTSSLVRQAIRDAVARWSLR